MQGNAGFGHMLSEMFFSMDALSFPYRDLAPTPVMSLGAPHALCRAHSAGPGHRAEP